MKKGKEKRNYRQINLKAGCEHNGKNMFHSSVYSDESIRKVS